MEKLNVLQKLNDARQEIRKKDLKKAGWNDYSKYAYYTPEQIELLVSEVCGKQKLFNKYDLIRTELGLTARLRVYDLESGEHVEYTIATEIPEIKATNVAQQLGGAVTYSERYLKMIAYEIKDNTLDFDTPKENGKSNGKPSNGDKRPDGTEKPWLNKWDKNKSKELNEYWEVISVAKEKGWKIADMRKYYKINKEVAKELETDLNQ
jgi:hypothetical protein